MTPQQENALRSIARQANSEIKKARQQFPDKNVDDICRSVLKKHRETVSVLLNWRPGLNTQELHT
ncbi:cell division protein ZapA [Escherichia coli]|uniref:cell division protein ZapA n=1 Tax=Escherichia coli TaxID=562 RepID=UPI001FCF1E08|nr:cell division protein ZapA [Escherichia coli]MDA6732692.1 cell division protein ZapA [Escherichia coli]MDO2707469.1 cell division protein ZapA [Escherichia coli]MDO2738173.1 cell division protein ZapA [Escherichia coli]